MDDSYSKFAMGACSSSSRPRSRSKGKSANSTMIASSKNKMNNDNNCTCGMGMNKVKGKDRNTSLQELERTARAKSNKFDKSILEIEDEPISKNVLTLGRFYRCNSFR